MADFQLDEYARRGAELLGKTRKIFNNYQDLNLPMLDPKTLPESMKTKDGAVKLVFVGQYSAGKSSIIKMLSGIDTEIGASIKTQEAHSYAWNDLEIIDTPGIHTELRPDHDEKTYYEIDHAALLIFVVTNEGFDDRMGHHFRKLAIDQKRAKNMVLVVNKMDRTALGNVPEQQQVIANDLLKVIDPYKPEDLYLSFLDTESYFEYLNETDQEMKDIYFEQSGREPFIENLNAFVKSRGVLSKIQAPLETLKSAITNIIGDSDNLTSDEDIEALEAELKREKRAMDDGKYRIRMEIEEIADTCADRITAEGAKAASAIAPGATEETVTAAIETAQANVDTYVERCKENMYNRLSSVCESVNKELATITSSNFAIRAQTNVMKKSMDSPDLNLDNIDKYTGQNLQNGNIFSWAMKGAGMGAKDAAKIGFAMPGLGTMNAAGVVKNMGHLFGVKFAPWGAINLVKGAANILGYIGIALTAYQILSKVFGSDKEREMRENIAKAQRQVTQEFNNHANTVRDSMINTANGTMNELTAPAIKEVEDKLAEFQRKKERLKSLNKDLQGVLVEVEALMDDVQNTATA